MNPRVQHKIKVLEKISEGTNLYKMMKARDGKFVIHRGVSENVKYLFIGEAGGKDEDACGLPFVGRSGKLLDEWIEHFKLKDVAIINSVPIMPENSSGGIRKPMSTEIEFFRPFINELIYALKPENIILLGRSANEFFSDTQLKNGSWMENLYGINVGFIYHPSYYLRNGKTGIIDFDVLMKNKEVMENEGKEV